MCHTTKQTALEDSNKSDEAGFQWRILIHCSSCASERGSGQEKHPTCAMPLDLESEVHQFMRGIAVGTIATSKLES